MSKEGNPPPVPERDYYDAVARDKAAAAASLELYDENHYEPVARASSSSGNSRLQRGGRFGGARKEVNRAPEDTHALDYDFGGKGAVARAKAAAAARGGPVKPAPVAPALTDEALYGATSGIRHAPAVTAAPRPPSPTASEDGQDGQATASTPVDMITINRDEDLYGRVGPEKTIYGNTGTGAPPPRQPAPPPPAEPAQTRRRRLATGRGGIVGGRGFPRRPTAPSATAVGSSEWMGTAPGFQQTLVDPQKGAEKPDPDIYANPQSEGMIRAADIGYRPPVAPKPTLHDSKGFTDHTHLPPPPAELLEEAASSPPPPPPQSAKPKLAARLLPKMKQTTEI